MLIFLDDVLVFSKSEEEHHRHLKLVFDALREANLKLKPKKCRLFQQAVTYLGYKLSADGIAPDDNKLTAVRDWKRPDNVTEVRSFVGFCGYYRRFIKDFAGIAKPLREITKKNQRFVWTPECHNAFEKLKLALIDSSILRHPDYRSPFILDTDASDNSLGAVLSNIVDGVEYPVAFASRVLSPAECRYSTTKREALAVIQAMKWFKPYIWGTKFVLRTDHASLQWLFRQNNDGMIFRMLQKLQEFDFQVVHRPGEKHGNADGLSRQCSVTPEVSEEEKLQMFGTCPTASTLADALGHINRVSTAAANVENEAMTIEFQEDTEAFKQTQQEDPTIRFILEWANAAKHPDQCPLMELKAKKSAVIERGEDSVSMWSLWDQLELSNGILYRKWHLEGTNKTVKQLVVPEVLREMVLEQMHDSKLSGGHFAFQKTLDRARQRFWWPKMRKDIERKCEHCKVCQARSTSGKKRKAPLQTINVGIRFSKVAADILGPVTKAKNSGAKYILALTDYFTKYVVCVPLASMTAEDVARAIVENWVLKFGAPDCLHTDQGANFCSDLVLEVCKLFGMEKTRTSPFHPQGNGMVERHNRVIADVISKYCADNPNSWDTMVPYLNFVYNTTVHRTTGHTPFSLVFGQECKYPVDLLLPKAPGAKMPGHEFTEWLEGQFREAHMNARETLGGNQQRQKDYYQKTVFGDELKVGQKVWLFAPHKAKSRKFYLPWDGPFIIVDKVSEVNYKISKENNAAKWQIVHYNRLKPYKEEEFN